MPVEVESFDIFDTLLTRPSGSPESMFLMLGRRLARHGAITCSPQMFAAQRAQAEARRFANAGGLDSHVGLADIIGELTLGLDADPRQIVAQEIILERAMLRPLPAGVERLRQAREEGRRIAFVSDMYLPDTIIEGLLRHHKLMLDGDLLLVSNRYAAAKRSGRLFHVLRQELGCDAGQIMHHGNDAISDVAIPRRFGFKVNAFAQGNANRYERLLDEAAADTDGLAGALAGASRLARNGWLHLSAHDRVIVETSTSVAAPMLIGFVLWTLRRARADGVRRLYFISRDGQLLLSLAKILAQRLGIAIELRYLYGSRQAWRSPALDLSDAASIDSVMPARINGGAFESVSTRALFARFGVSPEAVAGSLTEIGLHQDAWDRPLSEARAQAIRTLMLNDMLVRARLQSVQNESRQLVIDYLRQEGFCDGLRTGIVDLGTGATLYNALGDLLEQAGHPVPEAYYLGQRRDNRLSTARLPQRYLFDAREERGFCQHAGLIGFLEAVCSADHGSVIGYRRSGRRVDAITADGGVEPVQTWGHHHVREAVLATAEQLVLDDECVDWRADVRACTMAAFSAFWAHPQEREAEVWSTFPFDDGWAGHEQWIRLARPYRLLDALRGGYPHRHWWHAAAVVMSPIHARGAFAIRAFVVRAVRKLKRMVASRRQSATVPEINVDVGLRARQSELAMGYQGSDESGDTARPGSQSTRHRVKPMVVDE